LDDQLGIHQRICIVTKISSPRLPSTFYGIFFLLKISSTNKRTNEQTAKHSFFSWT